MHSLCLITDTNNPLEGDELLFLEALKADNFFKTDVQSWDDPSVDWARYQTAIIRTTWGYTKHVADFLRWARHIENLGVVLINSADAVEWNANKKYIFDLIAAGVRVLPTILVNDASTESFALPESTTGWVVKPTVGSSSIGIKKFNKNSPDDAKKYAVSLVATGVNALIQPFAEEITDGEVSFVFFGDHYSHACRKTPAAGDFRVQAEYGGYDRYFDAAPAQIEQARAVLKAAPFELLYARVDMLEIKGEFVLMELEAIEPYLFFGYNTAPQLFISVLKDHLTNPDTATS